MTTETHAFYERSYGASGLAAQRRYPNEELLRFIGSNFFHLPRKDRSRIRILEVGCGSGANLWMLAREGFETHGMDLSAEGLSLAAQMLASWGVTAALKEGSMTALDYPSAHFDVVVDVFSSYCLGEADFDAFSRELGRVLKPGGRFFSYTPSKASDIFRDPAPGGRLDGSTLDGIRRPTAPFHGNAYPFRFASPDDVTTAMHLAGLEMTGLERIGRSYRNGAEYFEFLSYSARRPDAASVSRE